MASDADPTFEVATIKPSEPGGGKMQVHLRGRTFEASNVSLTDLIAFAYNMQADQIVNLPKDFQNYRFDIVALPDRQGVPSMRQLQGMVQKLLTGRFSLSVHNEKRTLPVYQLVSSKETKGLTPSHSDDLLPHISMRQSGGMITLSFRNATLKDFASYLQLVVLERPILDETQITVRSDFSLTFTPDDSEFHGHPPVDSSLVANEKEGSSLYQAIKEQLGLALRPNRVPVDMIYVDLVKIPSSN